MRTVRSVNLHPTCHSGFGWLSIPWEFWRDSLLWMGYGGGEDKHDAPERSVAQAHARARSVGKRRRSRTPGSNFRRPIHRRACPREFLVHPVAE